MVYLGEQSGRAPGIFVEAERGRGYVFEKTVEGEVQQLAEYHSVDLAETVAQRLREARAARAPALRWAEGVPDGVEPVGSREAQNLGPLS